MASVVALVIASTGWRRRDVPGSLPFAGLMLAAGVWAFFSGLEYATLDIQWRILWSKFEYLGITTVAPCWLLFALGFSQFSESIRKRIATPTPWLFILPAIMVGLVFTNEWHGWVWPSVRSSVGPFGPEVIFEHGVAFWVFWIYAYTLMVAGTLALVISSTRFPAIYRRQSAAILSGAAIPWLFNLVYVLDLNPVSQSDWTPLAFVLAGVVYAFSVYRFFLFDVVPVAQDAVIESFRDGVIVLDARKRIVYLNPTARSLLQADDWIGKSPVRAFQGFPELLKAWHQASPASVEINLPGASPRIVDTRVAPVTGPRGYANGYVIVLRDITEQKAQEEQRKLQSVALAAAANGIVITDREGVISWVNPAFSQITGYTLEEVAGKKPSFLKSGHMDHAFYAQLWSTILAGNTWSGEVVNRRKDGAIYTEEQTIAPVRDASGQITHFIGIKQDITARKNLEQAQDMLLKSLVHDLRNPLNSILLALQFSATLPETVDLPQAVEHMLQIGRDSAQRMMGMINAILDISRLESGTVPLVREPVELFELAERACKQQASLASYGEIVLVNHIPHDLPGLYADPILLSRIFQNLLDNAIKFSPPNQPIELNAHGEAERHMLVVAITNHGPEIDPGLLPRIFDKYAAGSSHVRGTGLGLAFCRLAVEAHGGKIWAESSKTATTFFFTLPVTPD